MWVGFSRFDTDDAPPPSPKFHDQVIGHSAAVVEWSVNLNSVPSWPFVCFRPMRANGSTENAATGGAQNGVGEGVGAGVAEGSGVAEGVGRGGREGGAA